MIQLSTSILNLIVYSHQKAYLSENPMHFMKKSQKNQKKHQNQYQRITKSHKSNKTYEEDTPRFPPYCLFGIFFWYFCCEGYPLLESQMPKVFSILCRECLANHMCLSILYFQNLCKYSKVIMPPVAILFRNASSCNSYYCYYQFL